jgi:hypothetical protein
MAIMGRHLLVIQSWAFFSAAVAMVAPCFNNNLYLLS